MADEDSGTGWYGGGASNWNDYEEDYPVINYSDEEESGEEEVDDDDDESDSDTQTGAVASQLGNEQEQTNVDT